MGETALEAWDGAMDAVVNEINASTPDVVISILPSPMQEHFLLENKDKLSANLWYGMGTMEFSDTKKGILSVLQGLIRKNKLKKRIHSYSEEQEAEKVE